MLLGLGGLVLHALLAWGFGFLVSLLVVTVVAYTMHLLVEKPMLRLRDRLAP